MTDRLKPCPFCGGEAEMRVIKPHKHYFVDMPDYGGGVFIECTECTCAMSAETEEEAIENWNQRKPMERIVKALESEIEDCEKQVDKTFATSFSIDNMLKRNEYIGKISAYQDAIIIVEEGGREYE